MTTPYLERCLAPEAKQAFAEAGAKAHTAYHQAEGQASLRLAYPPPLICRPHSTTGPEYCPEHDTAAKRERIQL